MSEGSMGFVSPLYGGFYKANHMVLNFGVLTPYITKC